MTSLKVIVVDDEALARDYLKGLIDDHPSSHCIATCKSGSEAVSKIRSLRPDLVFLDIEMPGMSGFDVVKSLQNDTLPLIIFATAFQAYAIDAFEVQAVDYVLKPFDPERIHQAISRAQQRHLSDSSNAKSRYLAAIDDIAETGKKADAPAFKNSPQRLAIKEEDEIILVPYKDIAWIDAAGDYMCVHVGKKVHVLRCTMKELEKKLENSTLVRVHRSTLVNLDQVQSITPLPKGECELHLDNEVILKVSRSYRNNIEQLRH